MKIKIFLGSFLFAFLCQLFLWTNVCDLDTGMWANQAEYIVTENPRQYDFLQAYGHPGTVITDGTIVIHTLTGSSYRKSLIFFLSFFNGLSVAIITYLCFILRKDTLWWLGVLIIFSANRLYFFSTPPTAVVSLLVVLLELLSLYIYLAKKVNHFLLSLFSVVGGLAVATRADIGSLSLLAFLIFLKLKLSWKQIILIALGSFFIFLFSDTYMWYMPTQHVIDLVTKITMHHDKFTQSLMTFEEIIEIGSLSIITIVLFICFLFIQDKIKFPLPKPFLLIIGVLTIIVSVAILTSKYQVGRYFFPIIYMWEVFLPLLLFMLISKIDFVSNRYRISAITIQRVISIFIITTLLFFEATILIYAHSSFIVTH